MLGQFLPFLSGPLKEEVNSVCRNSTVYPVRRLIVPKDKVLWNVPWADYTPPAYSAPHLSNADWADPDITDEKFKPKWNEEDNGLIEEVTLQRVQTHQKYDRRFLVVIL
ncbi:ADP-ribose pyrophosphatase, mitochondrial [Caerostris extrusa]|uniref:ADP-ribose pyrophosphatase, mitochondrial n=1 Tax=Caerostris extrusa TaxID=172846 RepID=A0AAV4RM70_CAEEX|nr:ADP-ribose pyrophosphatase, mitochondrial [Caerostris extrusa]